MKPTVDNRPGDAPSSLAKYGAFVAIGVVVLLVGGLVIFGGGSDDGGGEIATGEGDGSESGGTTSPGDGTGETSSTAIGPPPHGDGSGLPIIYAEAVEEGTEADYEWGDRCDTDRGQVAIPTVYAPPCVPVFEGDNGGATASGVTGDTIRVVRYQVAEDDQLQALIASFGAADTRTETTDTFMGYLEALSSTTELYGRSVEIINYPATGASDDPVSSLADAETIAEQHDPFAVIGGPTVDGGVFAQELARQEIICIGCGLAVPDPFIRDNAPFIWGSGPSVGQFLEAIAAWSLRSEEAQAAIGEEPGLAIFAQDPDLAASTRSVGIIHFEQDPPVFDAEAEARTDALDGVSTLRETYLFDFETMQNRAVELITKMKSEGITTIMFLGDPVMPIFLTEQATLQDYWPEWLFTGTVLTDTNVLGRLYDQEQMRAAYGVSNLGTPVIQELQTSVAVWRWFHGQDTFPPARSQYGLLMPGAEMLLQGIHMAGPALTPQSFADGLFRMPPMGGGPTTPQVSYGNWGFFVDTDYFALDDSVEIWWDSDATEIDERGCEGTGLWRRSNGGERFTRLNAPLPQPFVEEGSVLIYREIPPEDQVLDYPSPPGSPAATGAPGRGADTELLECT